MGQLFDENVKPLCLQYYLSIPSEYAKCQEHLRLSGTTDQHVPHKKKFLSFANKR